MRRWGLRPESTVRYRGQPGCNLPNNGRKPGQMRLELAAAPAADSAADDRAERQTRKWASFRASAEGLANRSAYSKEPQCAGGSFLALIQDKSEGSRTCLLTDSSAGSGCAVIGNCSTVAHCPSQRRVSSVTCPSGNSNAS